MKKYLIICLPPLVLLAAKGIQSIKPRWLAAIALTTTAGLAAFALPPYYQFRSRNHEWKTVTDHIRIDRSGMFYVANSAAVTSVTAKFTTAGGVTRAGIVVYEISGAATASPIDVGPAANTFSTTQTSVTSSPLSTNSTNDILLLALDVSGDQSGTNNSFVPGAGFSFPATGSATNTRQAVSYEIVSSTQSNLTTSMSWGTAASNGTSEFIALEAASTTIVPPAVHSVSVNPTSVTGGQGSTGTVTLASAAPNGGVVVNLSSNNPAAQVPPTATVLANTTSVNFSITTSAVSTQTPVSISAASSSGSPQSTTLTVNPPGALQSVSVDPPLVTGGQNSMGTVTLTSGAPSGGAVVNLSSNNQTAQVPSTATVLANTTSATFSITTSAASASTPVTISAIYNGVTQTTNMTVTPTAVPQAVGVSPATVNSGQGSTGAVSLSSAAPSGGVSVNLSSSNPAVQVPPTVTVPANAASAIFSITTSAVSAPTQVTITATCNGVTQTAALTLGGSGSGSPNFALSVSISSDRTSATMLQGATLSGYAYVFTSLASQLTNFNPTGITKVSYWLDNTSMSGSPTHTELVVPYDFAATASNNLANPWDTTTVADGTHTITQLVTESNGSTEVDTATFAVQNKLSTSIGAGRYEYVFPDQNIYVYSLDNNFQLVKHVTIPQLKEVRGVGTVPSTHMLYLSFGGDGGANGNGSLLKYDLLADSIVWIQNYSHGIDSFTITPDGTRIYMPDGVNSGDGNWYIVDAVTGNELGSINTGTKGPHNTVASLDGAYVYGGPRWSSVLVEMSTATNAVALNIGPLNPSVRPFTINGKHTLAFTTASNASGIGFQVSNATTGNVLYTVTVPGFTIPSGFAGDTPNHGITLSPDEKEIYLIDTANAYVHVYDVTGLPASAPVLVVNIPLNTNFGGLESPCVYDCLRESWVRHTRDGHYVIVGDSGNVIDTTTHQVVNWIPALLNTRRGFLEIDWQNGVPVSTTTRYGLGRVTQ